MELFAAKSGKTATGMLRVTTYTHGAHHRHYKRRIKEVKYISFPDIEVRFAREVEALLKGRQKWKE